MNGRATRRGKWTTAAMAAIAITVWGAGRATTLAQTNGCGIDMRLLVLSADGREPSLQAITRTLDYLGTPYDRYIATEHPNGLTPSFLADGCRARYQAILQTTIDLAHQTSQGYVPAITAAESDALAAYQQQFQVRNVAWYTFPSEPLGFTGATPVDTAATPITMGLTAEGTAVFPYLNPSARISIRYAYTYLATPSDSSVTSLLTDASGHALVARRVHPDGRETLLQTFDGNPDLLHSTLLGYGLVSWATRGLFIGERHTYASPQVDDLFLDNNRWRAGTPCGTDPETTNSTIRMTGNDLRVLETWQRARNALPLTSALRITMAFNGQGTTGTYPNDTLTPAARASQGSFLWVNHTYDHEYLDDIPYGAALDEIRLNNEVARSLGLTSYDTSSMVTPNITGLTNPAFMRAAVDAGLRYVVSDASKPGYGNPFPNAGIYNPLRPSVLMIPRRANNLFYNVATPADWVSEYNCLYRSFWGRDFTFADILAYESHQLMLYLLRGENAPWMYHQPNLVAYDGTHSLLTDVLDRALDGYASYVNWPVTSPTMDALGAGMALRMSFLAARVTATLNDGTLTITSDRPVSVPITGLRTATAEIYGDQSIAHVNVPAGSAVTLPVLPGPGALPAGWDHRDIGAVGVAGGTSYEAGSATFSVAGAGADVWGTADAFRYAFVPVIGDVRITVRVKAIQNVAAWVKAGVMIRERLDPSAAHGFMLVSAAKGRAFQRRTTGGGASTSSSGGAGTAPSWVRLEREGSTVRAFTSPDGAAWTLVATDTIAMSSSVFAGLAVSSHTTAATAAATFDHVSIESLAPAPPPPPADVPSGWRHQDIGAVGATGGSAYDSATGRVTVSGAGADVWGTADAFHYAWQPWSGDGTIVARVASVQNLAAWVKAGVMIRASADPGAAHAFMIVSAGKGLAFQRRAAAGGASVSTSGGPGTAPRWVKLARAGNLITAAVSADGAAWQIVGSDTIPMGSTVLVGLAVSSHVTSTVATAVFDQVLIR